MWDGGGATRVDTEASPRYRNQTGLAETAHRVPAPHRRHQDSLADAADRRVRFAAAPSAPPASLRKDSAVTIGTSTDRSILAPRSLATTLEHPMNRRRFLA